MLALLLSGCAPAPSGASRGSPATFALAIEDAEAPAAFSREALGRRDRPNGARGLWAAVPGLGRPERAELVNLESGARVSVALFAGGGPATEARLSNAAADALAIGSTPQRVRITALRREPRLIASEVVSED